jgi:glycosyltransferase involved in cell wall biosynthesis
MKLLISAFAFSPLWGSEPAVGWNWAVELARHHDVTVLTHAHFRDHVTPMLAGVDAPRLRMEYLAVTPMRGAFHEQLLNSQVYYLRWQKAARRTLMQLLARERFDLVHHLTWGSFRLVAPLHGLPVPLVVGPLGGGERAPASLYRGLPWRSRLKEVLRDLLIWSGSFDPAVRRGWGDAVLLMCRTNETVRALPASQRPRAVIVHDIGSTPPAVPIDLSAASTSPTGRLRCLFVGRLIAWKGPHLALRALAVLRSRGVDATLTIIGQGELSVPMRSLATQLGLDDAVTWLDALPRDEVLDRYADHDVFLFPSLHDSGGTVVLESLSRGCPVVCLDLGGPKHFVTSACGRIVVASDGRVAEVPGRLADALAALAGDPALRARMRAESVSNAARHSWAHRVAGAYELVQQALAAA